MRLRSFLGWGVFVVLIAMIVHAVPPGLAMYHFLKGKRLFSSGQYEPAVKAYQQAIASNPNFARAYVELASSYSTLERYSEAEVAYKKAAAIEDDSCASCGLGRIYRIQGRREDAEKVLRHSVQVNARDSCPYFELGLLYFDQGNYEKAVECFTKASELNPRRLTYEYLGNCAFNRGKVAESIDFYHKAISLDSKNPSAHIVLGRALYRLGRYSEAVDACKQGLQLNPDEVMLRLGRGITECALGNENAANEEYRRLRELNAGWARELLDAIKRIPKEPTAPPNHYSSNSATTGA